MKNLIFTLVCLAVIECSANDSLKFIRAFKYTDKINQVLDGDDLYIRASAYSYGNSDPVNPSDIGEFVIARKKSRTYIDFKGQISYVNKQYSVQIDTADQSLLVSKSTQIPYSKIDIVEFNQCKEVKFIEVKGSELMLVFAFKPGNKYKQVEILFDTLDYKLKRINIEFSTEGIKDQITECKRIEIIYSIIQNNLPASIDNLLKEDIIGLNRKSKIEILSQKYVNYTIINLLEL